MMTHRRRPNVDFLSKLSVLALRLAFTSHTGIESLREPVDL